MTIVCDDFARDCAAVRAAVIDGGFTTQTGPDGALYTGISFYPVPQWFEHVAAVAGGPITVRLSAFRLNLAGELPHSWVHSDAICAEYASVLYLNPPEQCQGGTAFWQHVSGANRLLSPKELRDADIDADSYHAWMTNEWKNLTRWQQTGLIDMKFNRFLTYPTSYFHSRYPFDAFGADAASGRLIWICFYDYDKGVKT